MQIKIKDEPIEFSEDEKYMLLDAIITKIDLLKSYTPNTLNSISIQAYDNLKKKITASINL